MADGTLIAGADGASAAAATGGNADASKGGAATGATGATDSALKAAGTDAGATGGQPDAAKVAADAAAAEAAKAKTGAPEKYEAFKLPDGVKLDEAQVADLQATAKDLNLTQDQAQKLVDRELKVKADVHAAGQAEFKKTISDWAEQAKADKDIGGDKLATTLASAKRGLDAMETQLPGLKSMVDATGFGNHPIVIKLFQKIGAMTGEDGQFLAGGKAPGGPGGTGDKNSDAAVAGRMYPTMKKA